ncbi:hypothetical protein SAMN04488095_1983 [Jannaschia pohangensis]|uniref:Uncharacterized protein n=1 Tax=Jannaschia pohangensis TaxID=390807 RepID=A0A1I3MXR8_9RHOB|nr:hypothetical protein SAMN04488095_1983 [Jannaschia pohangensis]
MGGPTIGSLSLATTPSQYRSKRPRIRPDPVFMVGISHVAIAIRRAADGDTVTGRSDFSHASFCQSTRWSFGCPARPASVCASQNSVCFGVTRSPAFTSASTRSALGIWTRMKATICRPCNDPNCSPQVTPGFAARAPRCLLRSERPAYAHASPATSLLSNLCKRSSRCSASPLRRCTRTDRLGGGRRHRRCPATAAWPVLATRTVPGCPPRESLRCDGRSLDSPAWIGRHFAVRWRGTRSRPASRAPRFPNHL